MTKKQRVMLWRILAASALLLVLETVATPVFATFGEYERWIRLIFYVFDYMIVGYDILIKALRGIKNGQVFDENFLMAIATIGALALAIYENGDYLEAIAVMLFYQVGEWFQSYAVGKSRRNISQLMDIRPDYANIEVAGNLTKVDPDEVEVGTTIVVQPGEKVPIDGVVIEGASTLDTAALTGESMPRDVGVGQAVFSGCINMTGVLKIETTKYFGDSTVSKILDLVENASSRKSRSEAFISRFAKVYTPAVCIAALALAILPPIFIYITSGTLIWQTWVYRALTFLVASCPCALVISIPLSFFAGIGGASKQGILVKGSNYLEALSMTSIVVFDKTGTLTKGNFAVKEGEHIGMTEEEVLYYAAHAESASSHPISKSLREAYGKKIDRDRVSDIKEISGNGITAKVDGLSVVIGNDKLMHSHNITYKATDAIGTVIYIAVDGTYVGHIVIADVIKEGSPQAIKELKSIGIAKTVMLTGDGEKVAKAVADELGFDQYYSELLPADKVTKVEELIATKRNRDKLAFVGDGINDAPVLSRADIGIAMGAMGSDAAIEAADVVLMDDDPRKIAKAIKISRKCLRIVYENIIFAIGIKLLCLLLVAIGQANMWLAVFADVGVMVLAVLNAIRTLFVKRL